MMSNGIFISILVEYSWNTVEHGPSIYMIYDDLLNLNMVMFQFAISVQLPIDLKDMALKMCPMAGKPPSNSMGSMALISMAGWWLLLTPPKHMSSSVGMMKFIENVWKVINFMFQTTNQNGFEPWKRLSGRGLLV